MPNYIMCMSYEGTEHLFFFHTGTLEFVSVLWSYLSEMSRGYLNTESL